jgi:hypothetical protein
VFNKPSLEHPASLYDKARIPSTKERRNNKSLEYNNLRKVASILFQSMAIALVRNMAQLGPLGDILLIQADREE